MRGECSPEQQLACPLREHFTDLHHTYYPASDYRSRVERQFRQLPENKEQLCRNEHNEIHAQEPEAIKPPRDFMLNAIRAAQEAA